MKKAIVAMLFAASTFMVSCGNKTTEEAETEAAPVEEVAPVEEAAPVEADTVEAEVDTTATN